MGMVRAPLPTLFLVCEQEEISHQIYTQHFGFTSHTWRDLSSYLQMYAKQANYISRYDRKYETSNVVPLLRRGLLVKDGSTVSSEENSESSESSRAFHSESGNEGSSSSSNSSNKENVNAWTDSDINSPDKDSAKDKKQDTIYEGLSGSSDGTTASTRQPRGKKRPFAQISPRSRRVRARRAGEDCASNQASLDERAKLGCTTFQDDNSGHYPLKVPDVDAKTCIDNTTDRSSTRKRPARCLTRGLKWSEEDDAELRNDSIQLSVINIKDLPPDIKPILRDSNQTIQDGINSKSSVYRGVSRKQQKDHVRWRSEINFNGVRHNLGTFDSEQDAAAIYAWAHLILHGEDATKATTAPDCIDLQGESSSGPEPDFVQSKATRKSRRQCEIDAAAKVLASSIKAELKATRKSHDTDVVLSLKNSRYKEELYASFKKIGKRGKEVEHESKILDAATHELFSRFKQSMKGGGTFLKMGNLGNTQEVGHTYALKSK